MARVVPAEARGVTLFEGKKEQPAPYDRAARTLLEYFTAPEKEARGEPKKKRLRLETPAEEEKETGHLVCLTKVEFGLHFSREDTIEWGKELDCSNRFRLRSFDLRKKGRFFLSFAAREPKPTAGLTVLLESTELHSLEKHLDHIVRVAEVECNKNYDNIPHVLFTQLKLHNKSGNTREVGLELRLMCRTAVATEEPGIYKGIWSKLDEEIFSAYLPRTQPGLATPWALQDFYENVHVPPADLEVAPSIHDALPNSELYPFQAKAVDWLLRREGVRLGPYGLVTLESNPDDVAEQAPSFEPATDCEGRKLLVSHLRRMVIPDVASAPEGPNAIRGGILAEEMGLGKTVELIALMSLHRRNIDQPIVHDAYSNTQVHASGATLIITPPSILQQWRNELATHAPHLNVFHYEGIPRTTQSEAKQQEISVENLLKYDVVLATYAVIAREIYYTTANPERTLRHAKRHERRTSPLVQISWWRCCLDEAQMIESGVSNAALVARLIPRCNAWAVSGTPLRKDVRDLFGLLIFLRYEPFCSSKKLWSRVDKGTFKAVFSRLALRHTKDQIRGELRLPPQKRVVILSPFTAIEEQNYAQLFQQLCEECFVTPDGSPTQNDWDPDFYARKMRAWLKRLRQTCLHAQVGGENRKTLGRGAPLRTVDEVLDVMIDMNDGLVRTHERENVMEKVRRGHIFGNDRSDPRRFEKAREWYEKALEQASRWVVEMRRELQTELERLAKATEEDKKKKAAAAAAAADANSGASDDEDEDEDEDDDEQPDSREKARIVVLRTALRYALELEHICTFFIGSSWFQAKEALEAGNSEAENSEAQNPGPDAEAIGELEEKETKFYDLAKQIRKELLKETQSKAEQSMRRIRDKLDSNGLAQLTDIEDFEDHGGIESRTLLEKLDDVQENLNGQVKQLDQWREKVVRILLLPLVDEEEDAKGEAKGDEYEESTKAQDEVPIYVTLLRALVADRHLALTGQRNELVEQGLKFSWQQAHNPPERGRGVNPELFIRLKPIRDRLKPRQEMESLRAVIAELRSMATNFQWQADTGDQRAAAEAAIVERQLKEAQLILATQSKVVTELEKELELYHNSMNTRNEYYRQLQQISDTVTPYKEEMDDKLDMAELKRLDEKERTTSEKLAQSKTKRRFLAHLKKESTGQGNRDQERKCIICLDIFEVGVLTVCGHIFCKGCIGLWYKEKKSCPVCKRALRTADFHDVTYKERELHAQEETQSTSPEDASEGSSQSPVSGYSSIYSDMNHSTMNEINSKDLDGSFGTKIDTIARHILWLRDNDPGAKSIVFSQFSDFLQVLASAFEQFRIGYSSIGIKGGIERFRRDASAEVFLLDAKHDSSGLNLINATHVFLCEPLINPAIELQAIARVHRIGQQRPTTVYMYLIRDTVEENIYAISVERRLAHMGRQQQAGRSAATSGAATPAALQENALDKANSLELQQAPLANLLEKKGAGEVVNSDDVWSCLFSKPRRQNGDQLAVEVGRHLRAQAAVERARGASANEEGEDGS